MEFLKRIVRLMVKRGTVDDIDTLFTRVRNRYIGAKARMEDERCEVDNEISELEREKQALTKEIGRTNKRIDKLNNILED